MVAALSHISEAALLFTLGMSLLEDAHAQRGSISPVGAKCDGQTDDTLALVTWLAKIRSGAMLTLPVGTCIFKSQLVVPSGGISNVTIIGSGPYTSILEYRGTSPTTDLLTIGDGTNQYQGWYLSNFRITSETTMSAPSSALHLRYFVRSDIRNIIVDGQDGTGRLFNGAWFDGVDYVSWMGGEFSAQNDALRVNGFPTRGSADFYLSNAKIAPTNGSKTSVGVHVGGGFGGFYCDATDIIGNDTNFLIDNTLSRYANREITLGVECALDSARNGDNLTVTDELANGGSLMLYGWYASSITGNGVNIANWRNGNVTIYANEIYNNALDGIRIQDASTYVSIGTGTKIRFNGKSGVGYGINSVVPTLNVTPGAPPINNASGAYSPNTQIAGLGYSKSSDGRITEWGTALSGVGIANSFIPSHVKLPYKYPNDVFQCSLTVLGYPNGPAHVSVSIQNIGTDGFNMVLVSSSAVKSSVPIGYLCIGN